MTVYRNVAYTLNPWLAVTIESQLTETIKKNLDLYSHFTDGTEIQAK